jgi:hypothetical protein
MGYIDVKVRFSGAASFSISDDVLTVNAGWWPSPDGTMKFYNSTEVDIAETDTAIYLHENGKVVLSNERVPYGMNPQTGEIRQLIDIVAMKRDEWMIKRLVKE